MAAITPQSYYYSGQGRLLIGERDPLTGKGINFMPVGNVTSLTIDIATTKFEHKESQSGARSVDLTIITEKKANVKFSTESLSMNNLAVGLFGEQAAVTGGTGTVTQDYLPGGVIVLPHPNVSGVTGLSGVEGVDYILDAQAGTIYLQPDSTVLTTAGTMTVGYTYGAHDRMDAFTSGTNPERYLRFDGLNTVNGDMVVIDMPRVALEPLTGLELINENLGKADMAGSILLDNLILTGSQFFVQRNIKAPVVVPPAP